MKVRTVSNNGVFNPKWVSKSRSRQYYGAYGMNKEINASLPPRHVSCECKQEQSNEKVSTWAKSCSVSLMSSIIVASTFFPAFPSFGNQKIAEFATSGFLFKDSVIVVQLNDPEIEGVKIYYTDYNRSIQEKLSSDPFADPSQSSISCVATEPVVVSNIESVRGNKEIFSESKSLNFIQNKRTRIRRVVDEDNKVALYIAYSTRNTSSKDEGGVSSSRYRTSMCGVPISEIKG